MLRQKLKLMMKKCDFLRVKFVFQIEVSIRPQV